MEGVTEGEVRNRQEEEKNKARWRRKSVIGERGKYVKESGNKVEESKGW